jgi:subtilase-type serine protease
LLPRHLKHTPLAALLLAVFTTSPAWAIESYPGDPGMLGSPSSWRTTEFNRDWGLLSVGAEFAYSAGFSGAGVTVGVVDSGYFASHPQLPASRYSGLTVDGIDGPYNQAYNDTHGTHVVGTIAGARDGSVGGTSNFHGVAFNANVLVGNTHKTDGVLYGIPQTSQTAAQTIEDTYVANVYRALAAQNLRIIGTSFGSQPNSEQYQTLYPTTGTNLTGRAGLYGAWAYIANQSGTNPTWFQGALDAAATGTIIAFSAGNGGYANPTPRAAAAYFRPELESNWLAVGAIRQTLSVGGVAVGQSLNADGSVNVPGAQLYNQCGVAKWSCVTAPGNAINGSTVTVSGGVPTATYSSLSGTSMAQPHASGAIAVMMERFPYMTNEQILTVAKTTAIQNGTINDASGVAIANPTRGQIVVAPDDRNGWGTISLRYAMNGPGQFTGAFAVNTQGQNDTWSNNISDVAIRGRQAEDAAEAAAWAQTKITKGWESGLPANATADERTEYETGVAREAARATRVYAGSLSKDGAGTLRLTGNNSWTGGTQVLGGALIGASATAFGSGDVIVHGGLLGGNAIIQGLLRNEGGIVAPGDGGYGVLGVLGSFAQLAGGTLGFDVGTDGSDLLTVAGSAALDGTLSVSFSGLSQPGTFALIQSSSYSGQFSSLTFTGLGEGGAAHLVYGANGISIEVTAVPEPATWALWLGGAGFVGWTARRRRATRRA